MSELASLLELLGREGTLKLVEAYGGTRVAVPKKMPAEHPLRTLLGDAGFGLLYQYFGGSEIAVPMARGWRIDFYQAAGLKPREIARKTGCTEAAVYAHFSRRGVPGQASLIFEDAAPSQNRRR